MTAHWISIYALAAMFVVATVLPINMGVIAFVGAFLIGTLAAGMNAKAIMAGFPADLFLTLVGITYLFALAQNNGSIDWLVQAGGAGGARAHRRHSVDHVLHRGACSRPSVQSAPRPSPSSRRSRSALPPSTASIRC